MDGKTLLYKIQQLLNEDSSSAFLDERSSYQFLWEAATEFSERTNAHTNTQTITTVADQTDYTLDANFLKLRLKDDSNRYYIKYNDGTNDSFIYEKSISDIIIANNSTSVAFPDSFTIEAGSSADDQTGTATSTSAASNGLALLIDSGSPFTDMQAGDMVHNTSDGSDGIVLTPSIPTSITTALFGGTNNYFTAGDGYYVAAQGRLKLVLDPPPSVSGHTMEVQYNARPIPVFSAFKSYPFQSQYSDAIVHYALWKYKYRDSEPNFGDAYFKFFEQAVGKANGQLGDALRRRRIPVSFKARRR